MIVSLLRGLLVDHEKTNIGDVGNVTGVDSTARHVIVDAGDKQDYGLSMTFGARDGITQRLFWT